MVRDEVLLKLRVAVCGGPEEHLPLLARTQFALMPEHGRERPVNLGAGGELGFDG